MLDDQYNITVHIAGQIQRHVAKTILIVKLSHGIFGSLGRYMIQYSETNSSL